jgi:tetratricopeptide (TPR) repeat protein
MYPKRVLKKLLSDHWLAVFSRLVSITLIFLAFYSESSFKIWFDNHVGQSLWVKVLVVLSVFFLIQWILSWRQINLVLEPELAKAQNQLAIVSQEIKTYENSLDSGSPETAFTEGLVRYILSLSEKGRDKHILRLRNALSRHLWVEGMLRARVALGEAAAAAAARLGDDEMHIAALVDDLGWTLVAMEKRTVAKAKIETGLRSAERTEKFYWAAKCCRHLAGIYTIEREFEKAYSYITRSEEAANKIIEDRRKIEMLAGIKYATSITLLYEGKYEEAMQRAEQSEELFLENRDATRSVRSYALKGKILFRMGGGASRGEAQKMFLRGLNEAEGVGRKDEIIRNLIGLASIADLEEDKEAADKYRSRAKRLAEDTPVPYELIDHA